MRMSAAEAITRGAGLPAGDLLGPRLFTAWQLDSVAVAVLVVLAAVYLTGVALLLDDHLTWSGHFVALSPFSPGWRSRLSPPAERRRL